MGVGVNYTPPASDQIEFCLFGPGHGESGVVHLGDNKWVIIDSCIDNNTNSPAALDYLRKIGVNAEEAVVLVVATHWHDDHVRGLSEILTVCRNAKFCCSSALSQTEFMEVISAYNKNNKLAAGSGTSEMYESFKILKGRKVIHGIADRPIYKIEASNMGHGRECCIYTLSPSDEQIKRGLLNISQLMPEVRNPKGRAVACEPNDTSVVVLVKIGEISLLLGGDLEEHSGDRGWTAIVQSTTRPKEKATIFKIPHHGSQNAHNDEVWTDMLREAPFAILAPYNKTPLPMEDDVTRICGLTPHAYSTSNLKPKGSYKRLALVEKMIKDTAVVFESAEPRTGCVQLRNVSIEEPEKWNVNLGNTACSLSKIRA